MSQFNASSRAHLKLSQAAGEQAEPWVRSWSQLVEDPWYQENLDKRARRVLRRANCPLEWIDDLKQDAMLLLARQLSHLVNPATLEPKLASPGWLLAAIRGHCQEALRRIVTAHRRCTQIANEQDFPEASNLFTSIIDLRDAIERLDEPQRTILQRQANGNSLLSIAHDQRLSYSQVWRIYRRGIEQLRARLLPTFDEIP
jgi:RNA polymerase sigma factor (sigma-70 family)